MLCDALEGTGNRFTHSGRESIDRDASNDSMAICGAYSACCASIPASLADGIFCLPGGHAFGWHLRAAYSVVGDGYCMRATESFVYRLSTVVFSVTQKNERYYDDYFGTGR